MKMLKTVSSLREIDSRGMALYIDISICLYIYIYTYRILISYHLMISWNMNSENILT